MGGGLWMRSYLLVRLLLLSDCVGLYADLSGSAEGDSEGSDGR